MQFYIRSASQEKSGVDLTVNVYDPSATDRGGIEIEEAVTELRKLLPKEEN